MEDKKYPIVGYAPGNYHCRCSTCERSFFGDKRAVQCEPCAVATKEKFDALSPDEQKELMESNAEAIREAFSIGGKKCNCNEPYDSEKHGGGYPRCPVHDKAIEIPRQIGTALPTDEQPSPVWVKASERLPATGLIVWRWLDKTEAYTGYKEKGGFHFGTGGARVDSTYYSEIEWLDESAPSGERDHPYAGFRETIENIIHSAGKHNQEQCTEIADAILRDLSIGLCCQKKKSPSGEREGDAVAFVNWLHLNAVKVSWDTGKLTNHWVYKEKAYTTAQLYDIFKQQKEKQ